MNIELTHDDLVILSEYLNSVIDRKRTNTRTVNDYVYLAVIDHLCSILDDSYDLSSDLAPVAKEEPK